MKEKGSFIVIVVLLVSSCFISWRLYFKVYSQEDTVSIHAFPKELKGWISEEIPITQKEYAILETKNVFVRKYTGPKNEEVFLFVVYSQNNRKVSHPPEICYQGGGTVVTSHTLIPLDDKMKVNKLFLDQPQARQVAYYWFKVGDSFISSYWTQQFMIALKTLLGQPASSALIRVSSVIKDADSATEADVKKFSTLIVPQLFQYLP